MRGQHVRRAGGFTYLSVIIVVAIIGLVTAASLKLGATIQRSRAEQQLLVIGAAFSDALQSYADATPSGQLPQPATLKDLLRDPRFPTPRRHLRKIFVDPMTGKDEWGIVYLGAKTGVVAVYSLSDAKPVKIGNFPARFQSLAGKRKISEWRFVAAGPGNQGVQQAAPATPPPGSFLTPQPEPVPEVQPAQPAQHPPAEPVPEPEPAPEPEPPAEEPKEPAGT